MRLFITGIGVALAIAMPAMLVAQILVLVLDDDLPAPVTVVLTLTVCAGPVLGAWTIGRRGAKAPRLQGLALGLVTIGVIAVLGAIRLDLADKDPRPFIIPVLMAWGAVLGMLGATVGAHRARTHA